MSRHLDSLLDPKRRADCAANDPITSAREIRARGNHLAAQNDEPEFESDAQLAEDFAGDEPFEVDSSPRRLPLYGDRRCTLCHGIGHNCPECSGWED